MKFVYLEWNLVEQFIKYQFNTLMDKFRNSLFTKIKKQDYYSIQKHKILSINLIKKVKLEGEC